MSQSLTKSPIFVDTAAFYAILVTNDRAHQAAATAWIDLLHRDHTLVTSNYVAVETVALLQARHGIEAARLFHDRLLPATQTMWIDAGLHMNAMAALLTANRRDLSLVDCTSFGLMRATGFDVAFTFDQHFTDQGFTVIP